MRGTIYRFIQKQDELNDFLEMALKQKWIAIDSEFVRAHEYHPKLCLLQIQAGTNVAVIDTLIDLDFSSIIKLITDHNILKLIHGCEQDAEVLHHTFGAYPQPIFDTQIAAAFLGEEGMIGYAELVEKLFGKVVAKDYQYSEWDKRPLTEAMLEYAASDVLHLNKIYALQKELLIKNKTYNYVLEESYACARSLNTRSAVSKNFLKLHNKVKSSNMALLMKLILLRESAALNKGVRRQLIINDEHLVKYVDQKHLSKKHLDKLNLESFRDLETMVLPEELDYFVSQLSKVRLTSRAVIKDKVSKLREIVALQAQKLGIYPTLACSKADAILYLIQEPHCKLLTGWRKEVFGESINEVEVL